ncbi:MAG: helicase C-terminal domain-containing protein [Betaproteobacteria bacterium]
MCQDAAEGQPPIAKWIEVASFGGKDIDYLISASPVSAGRTLKEFFWDKALGVVLTSATLTALNSFDLFLEQSGLSLVKEHVKSISLPTPFDYQTQGTLVMPKMKFSPKDVVGHTAEVIELMPDIYPARGGMLVLFTSRKQMTEVRDGLPPHLKAITMMQGDTSLSAMLNAHKKRVNDGEINVLFGLDSLSEGVDLPGDLCLRVVVVKLPFDVPTEPIGKSYSEWLESIGRNSFFEISLPSASRKLEYMNGCIGSKFPIINVC